MAAAEPGPRAVHEGASQPSSSTRHVALLDLARGVSAQLVVVGHLGVLAFPMVWARTLDDGRIGARTDLFQVQSYAVVVFLVLSGYVITRSVRGRLRTRTFSLRSYALDRAVRILTPFIPAIPLVLIGDRVFLGPSLWSRFVVVRHDLGTAVVNLLQLQDNAVLRGLDLFLGLSLARRSFGSAAPWWTVAYEWWIYLLFGGVVALALIRSRHRPSRIAQLALVALTGFALLSVVGFAAGGNFLVLGWLVGFGYAWWDERLCGAHRVLGRVDQV